MPPSVVVMVRRKCWELGYKPERIISGDVSRNISHARQEVMRTIRDTVVMADGLPPSYPVIGRWFGRDHTSVIHAVNRARERAA